MTEQSKGRKVGYWVTTVLVVAGFGFSGVLDTLLVPNAVAEFTHLGYPEYFARLLGIAKLLGVIAILLPKFPRLKEWAYAGIVIDLISAVWSHLATGDGPDKVIPPAVFLAIAFASWWLRPADRRLPDPPAS